MRMQDLGNYRRPNSEGQTFTLIQKSTYGESKGIRMEFVGNVFGKDKWHVWTTGHRSSPASFRIVVDGNHIVYQYKKYTKEFGNRWTDITMDLPYDLTSMMGMATIRNIIDSYWKERQEEIEKEYLIPTVG